MSKSVKKCSKCFKLKSLDGFYRNGDKYRPDCKVCKKTTTSKYRKTNNSRVIACKKRHYDKNRGEILIQRKEKYNKNKDLINKIKREKYKANPRKMIEHSLKYYYLNHEECLKRLAISNKNHYLNNKSYYRAKSAKRRALKKNATIGDYNKELIQIYKKCPNKMDVDHIMPLKGVDRFGNHILCGLHVPWNLQYLDPIENRIKSNKVRMI